MRRRALGVAKLKTPLKIICITIFAASVTIQILSAIHLRNMADRSEITPPRSKLENYNSYAADKIGEFGEMVLSMLPEDLRFTLFLPSERALYRELRLEWNDSNTYAVLTRILGFSAVPKWISLEDLELGKEKVYESVSGFNLHVYKNLEEKVVANAVVSVGMVQKRGSLLVHVMDGVVMDAEFQQSVETDDSQQN